MNSLTELNTFSATGVPYYNNATSTTVTSAYRYAFNGVVSTDKSVMQNLEAMATACGAWMSYDSHDGKWSVVINKTDSSIASFTDANIIGPITVSGTDINELYNQVHVQFPHIDLNDNLDYVNVEIPIGSRGANEPINSLEMQFDLLNDPVQAQLLGTINLKQSRVDKVIRFVTDYSKLGLKAGNVIDITSDIYGFTAKKFRITSLIEKDADDGSIQLDITALEYDENVYSTADLNRYVVSNSTGIIGIGSIGKPGLPEVVKTEVASLPKITVTSTSPTGIVEAMEFWYTRDVPPTNNVDSTRSYTLLGTVKPTNGTTFAYGTAVSLDVSTLGAGNFLIKSRGVNTTTAGQYSDPSGVVYYAPVQVTDGIGDDTALYDSTGSLIATLGINYLLNNLDQLFKGNVSIGSIFDQVFGLFKDETGVDIVTQANTGTTLLGISNDGVPISNTTANIDFKGTGITNIGAVGNDVTITIDGANYTAGNGIVIDANNVISSTTIANVSPGFYTVKAGNTIATTSNIIASNGSTISFVAGPGTADGSKILISGNPGTNVVTIDLQLGANLTALGSNISAGGGTGNVSPNVPPVVTSYTSTLRGTAFPALFGSGPVDGVVDSRAGIFTHDHMVFGGSSLGGLIKSTNIISTSKDLTFSANGLIRDFYNFPSLSSGNWSRKPWYDESILDKYAYDSKISVYYSTATYGSGSLDEQAWSPWKLINSNTGETGFNGNIAITVPAVPAVYANTWSNPQPTITTLPDAPYIVEEVPGGDYISGTYPDAGNQLANYDPFKANVLIVNLVTPAVPEHIVYEEHNDLTKATSVATGTTTPITFNHGSNKLIMFGVSVYNAPDATPVANNTVFGHATPHYVNAYPDSRAFKQVANNGSRFVAISATDSSVFWSDDGMLFTRVSLDSDVTAIWERTTPFEFVIYAGTMFYAYDAQNGAATSADGKIWTEYAPAQGVDALARQVSYGGGLFVAVGANGVQTSTDGITFTAPTSLGQNLNTVIYDGSTWLIGSKYLNSQGSALYTSTDGATWTASPVQSDPGAIQTMSSSDYLTNFATVSAVNSAIVGALP